MLVYIFIALGIVLLGLFLLKKTLTPQTKPQQKQKPKEIPKFHLGEIQIFYASQTGTAAKMANTFVQQAAQQGFKGVVINLKQISHQQFKKNQISIFFMANTGEGDPPQNSITFMKMLKGKVLLNEKIPSWNNLNYSIFGLGDTQYEHFNKTAIITDQKLQQLGANKLTKVGLGDANSSIQDDYTQWKQQLWPKLIKFRQNNPYSQQHHTQKITQHISENQNIIYLSQNVPIFANFRFCIQKQSKYKQVIPNQLDFKTKASLLGHFSPIKNIQQKRQNNQGGSSLQIQIELQNNPQYQTASNIALWPTNDPLIISQILSYFQINPKQIIDIQIINRETKNKFNFITPATIQEILENYIDLQFKITKAILKKLAKFQSNNQQYFIDNSSPKTTQEFKKLTEKQFNYLFKLIQHFQVKLTFEDFVQLSDSIGPRLFTIASSWKFQKNVQIVASIAENGLISKNFISKPERFKAELRKSTFTDIQKWKKVIFIGAGTGFAPFRGYLQDKQLAVKEGRFFPIITLFFGCRKSNSDYIYKEQIQNWEKTGIINKLHLAFSRQTDQKIYVQDLLDIQKQELFQYINDPQTSLLVCGALAMGRDVVEVLERNYGKTSEEFKKQMANWQKTGKLVKELW